MNISELSSKEAESRVLEAILFKPNILPEVAEKIIADDFAGAANQAIYAAMLALLASNTAIDLVTLTEALKKAGKLEKIGGIVAVTRLAENAFTAANVGQYIETMKEYSKRRKLARLADEARGAAYDVTKPLDVAEMQAKLADIAAGETKAAAIGMQQAMLEYAVWLNDRASREWNGLLAYIAPFDTLVKGFQAGDLDIIAARPSVGKTAFALNIALNAALHGETIALYSLEMSREQIINRMVSMLTGIDGELLNQPRQLSGDDMQTVLMAIDKLAKLPMHIIGGRGMSAAEIVATAKRIHAKQKLKGVLIDYLQLIDAGRRKDANRVQEIGYITAALKNLAGDIKAPVIVLSQLSRGTEQRNDKRPMLSDLRDSGNIEQDADMVIMLYREDYYSQTQTTNAVIEFGLRKNRNGATGTVRLLYMKNCSRFMPLPHMHETISDKDVPL